MRRFVVALAIGLIAVGGCRSGGPGTGSGAVPSGRVRVTWYGASMFLVQDSRTSLLTDPYGPDAGYIVPDVSAKIVLISNSEYNVKDAVLSGPAPRVIEGIGKSYVGRFAILGVPSIMVGPGSAAKRLNTIYYWEMGDISLAHMGDFGQKRLSNQQRGLLRGVDVLMMPVGGRSVSDAKTAAQITKAIGPRVVIPMDYKTPAVVADLGPVETFSSRFASIRRLGESVDVSRQELPAQTEVWVMKYRQERP